MAKRDIIVIGASAGGIDPLKTLVHLLPRDLAAAILVVVHIAPWRRSDLPFILNHSGHIPALHPASGQIIEAGTIYVAPPDFHMLIQKDRIQLWHGPKENQHRPSVNTLFRSAAVAFKKRVVGVVLSGLLDDGSTGLWWVKEFGGLAVVQDPQEAAFPDMPQNALQNVAVDHVLTIPDMASLLASVAGQDTPARNMRRK